MAKKNCLRASDGVELMSRFAKRQPVLRAEEGFEAANAAKLSAFGAANPGLATNAANPMTPAPATSGSGSFGSQTMDAAYYQKGADARARNMGDMARESAAIKDFSASSLRNFAPESAPAALAASPAPTALAAPPTQETRWGEAGKAGMTPAMLLGGMAGTMKQPTISSTPALAEKPKPVQGFGTLAFNTGGSLRSTDSYQDSKGGEVPGDPEAGDKFPAKYTGGEFVVSNDMLKAQPGLREELRDLRGNVLAAKGMTPQEADAKAMNGGSLRARDAWEGIPGSTSRFSPPPTDGLNDTELGRNVNNAMNAMGGMGVVASVPLRAVERGSAAVRGMNAPPVLINNIPKLAAPAAKEAAPMMGGAPVFNVGANGVASAQHGVPALMKEAYAPVNTVRQVNAGLQEGAMANSNAALLRTASGVNAGMNVVGNGVRAALHPKGGNDQPHTSTLVATPSAPPQGEDANYSNELRAPMRDDANYGVVYKKRQANGNMSYSDIGADGVRRQISSRPDGTTAMQDLDSGVRKNLTGLRDDANYVKADGRTVFANGNGTNTLVYNSPKSLREDAELAQANDPRNSQQYKDEVAAAQAMNAAFDAEYKARNGNGTAYDREKAEYAAWFAKSSAGGSGNKGGYQQMKADEIAAENARAQQRNATELMGHQIQANTQLRTNDSTNTTLRRGQDISSGDSRYGHELTKAVSLNRLRYDIGKDQRDFAMSKRTADQAYAKGNEEAATEVYKNKFFTSDGKRDEHAEKNALDISKQLTKGAFGLAPRETQARHQQDVQELTDLFSQIETPRKTGANKYMSAVGLGDEAPRLTSLPKFASFRQLGPNLTAGTGNNDWELTDSLGRKHYVKNMSERQLSLLDEMGAKLAK